MNRAVLIFGGSILILAALIAYPLLKKNSAATRAMSHEGEEEPEAPKGPHGGRLLREGEFQAEVTIFEKGVPPEYRVFAYENEKLLDPGSVNLTIQLNRLGGRVDTFRFRKQEDYLRSDGVVEEPHSFDVKVSAEHKGKKHHWEYPSYEGRTTMSAEAMQTAGIQIENVGPAIIKKMADLPGEIILNPDRQTHVVPRFSGVVNDVKVNLGDAVQKGQPLAVIESMDLAEEKRLYIEAMHKLEFAQKAFEREQLLWDKKITSEQDYLSKKHEYEEANIRYQTASQKLNAIGISGKNIEGTTQLASYVIRSPIGGSVIEKSIASGQAVEAHEELFVIADLGALYVEVTVPTQSITSIREGLPVTVVSDAIGAEAAGRITYIGPLLGEDTRSAKARVVFENSNANWRPGLFVKVQIVEEETTVPVAVKASALQTFRDWDVVFLAVGNTFEIRPLELGRRDGEWVEVLSGISPGDRYVTENSFIVKADVEKSGATHDH